MGFSFHGIVFLAGFAVVASACAQSPPAEDVTPTLTACLSEEQKALVGQNETAARAILPEISRIIPPNSAVTQDFRPDRVNVDLDETGTVTRVWCG